MVRLLTFFLLLYACSAHALLRWQQDDYITHSFIEIAFNTEYSKTKRPYFSRWKQPLKLFIKSALGNATLQRTLFEVQALHLHSITGHPIDFVETEADANIIVIFTSAEMMKTDILKYANISHLDEIIASAECIANYRTNNRQEIYRGLIVIPVDKARQNGRLVDCVIEELTQVLGLPNDSERVFPSIFNDRSIDSYLSGLDYLLLKIAYHPNLTPGMTQSQVRAQLPVIINELRSRGEIEEAQSRVLTKSMKSWVER